MKPREPHAGWEVLFWTSPSWRLITCFSSFNRNALPRLSARCQQNTSQDPRRRRRLWRSRELQKAAAGCSRAEDLSTADQAEGRQAELEQRCSRSSGSGRSWRPAARRGGSSGAASQSLGRAAREEKEEQHASDQRCTVHAGPAAASAVPARLPAWPWLPRAPDTRVTSAARRRHRGRDTGTRSAALPASPLVRFSSRALRVESTVPPFVGAEQRSWERGAVVNPAPPPRPSARAPRVTPRLEQRCPRWPSAAAQAGASRTRAGRVQHASGPSSRRK
ncbi:uncharacterized protein LOC112985566 isoform X2 [Dromaius novaehollandiae]|uniref:uncharacterized protein LOC112985566 isoform X2 n=1 Tax=Dromaius novaehollandiae TaxID=8790 RepID=UPI00311EBA33